jgi:hypothetical protein
MDRDARVLTKSRVFEPFSAGGTLVQEKKVPC